MELMTMPGSIVFQTSGAILVLLSTLYCFAAFLGLSGFEPDVDIEGGDAMPFLSWLNLGRIPLSVLLMLLLASFTAVGFTTLAASASVGLALPAAASVAIAGVGGLFGARAMSRPIGAILPRDESYAVTLDELIGKIGWAPETRIDDVRPALVRVRDAHGNQHAVMAMTEPGRPHGERSGEVVLVRRSENGNFLVRALH